MKYKEQLEMAFNWFLENNHFKQIIYNPENACCYGGSDDKTINITQGAESTLCVLRAQLIMEKYVKKSTSSKKHI
jgi:hypothetical protein